MDRGNNQYNAPHNGKPSSTANLASQQPGLVAQAAQTNRQPGALQITRDQIEQVFIGLLGVPARAADLHVIHIMGGTVDVLAEYLWDHWMGEPDQPDVNEVTRRILDLVAPSSHP